MINLRSMLCLEAAINASSQKNMQSSIKLLVFTHY